MGRKVGINYSKVKEISDLGLSIKETLDTLHQCNISISRMQYYRWKHNNVTSNHSSKVNNNVTSNDDNTTPTDDNVTLKGRYEVVGLGLKGRDELKGKRFDTLEEITSMCIPRVFIYDYNEGKCLTPIYQLDN